MAIIEGKIIDDPTPNTHIQTTRGTTASQDGLQSIPTHMDGWDDHLLQEPAVSLIYDQLKEWQYQIPSFPQNFINLINTKPFPESTNIHDGYKREATRVISIIKKG